MACKAIGMARQYTVYSDQDRQGRVFYSISNNGTRGGGAGGYYDLESLLKLKGLGLSDFKPGAKPLTFGDLAIGQGFNWIDPTPGFPNSFFDDCVKVSPRKYTAKGQTYRVGTIKAHVFNVKGV